MTLTIYEENGDEIIITCLIAYLNHEECKKYHRGNFGCDPKCPHNKKELML